VLWSVFGLALIGMAFWKEGGDGGVLSTGGDERAKCSWLERKGDQGGEMKRQERKS
jgi:hypothetical protein